MIEIKAKINELLDIINSDRDFKRYCSSMTIDAMRELCELLLDRDLIIGSKEVLKRKLKVDSYQCEKDKEYTIVKTGICYQKIEFTNLVKDYKYEYERLLKEEFIEALEIQINENKLKGGLK